MDHSLEEVIEIKEEIIEDDIEIEDNVFEEKVQPVAILPPKQPITVNIPVKVSKPKPSNVVNLPVKVSQPKPSNVVNLPEIKCMVEDCPTKGRNAETNYFCLTEQRYDPWLKALGQDPSTIKLDPAIPYKYLVCQRHFRQCDFRGRLQKINDDAIPSLNLPPKAEIVEVVPHNIVIVEDIVELDDQSQELCFTVFQKLKNGDVPPGKNKIQQAALLCGVSYHTIKKIIKSRKEVKTKTKSLISALLQIEKLSGQAVPSIDFYYKQLRNYPSITCTKKELLYWLKVTGVNFKKIKKTGKGMKEDPIVIIDTSDEEVETHEVNPNLVPSGNTTVNNLEIEKLLIDEESLVQEKNVQPLFITVKEANLLHLLPKLYEPFKIEGKVPSIDYYCTSVLEKTKEFFSVDTLKHWLDQLNIKYENEQEETCTPFQNPKIDLKAPQQAIEVKEEPPETEENMEIEKLIGDEESLEQEKNVQPLFITVKEVNLLHLLPKLYEPFRIECKIPSFDYYQATVAELCKDVFNKDTLKHWLDQLNIKYENEQVQLNAKEMPSTINSALNTVYKLFYSQNASTKIPTLKYMYDNLKKLLEEDGVEFTRASLIQWLHALSMKFEIDEDIISLPSLAYFDSQLTLREHSYSKEAIATWLKQLKIHFKDKQKIGKEYKELTDDLLHLLIQSNKEFYKASPTSKVDPTITNILTDLEYRFHNSGTIATLDAYYNSLVIDAGITCTKINLANWLDILGIKYSINIPTTNDEIISECNRKLPSLDYFCTKLGRSNMKRYSSENIRYWLKQLKIDYMEVPSTEPHIQEPAILHSAMALKLQNINKEWKLIDLPNRQELDFESIAIIKRLVDESGPETPSIHQIHHELFLNNKHVSKPILKEWLTCMNIKFTPKNYQYSKLIDEITAAVKYECRIPTLEYFYVNTTAAINVICSRKQLQKWLDVIGILYYPSSIEDGHLSNEAELTSQLISFLIKLDREFPQSSSARIINILISINDKFVEKGETPTLNFIHHYLQSYRLFCDENPSYYSKDVLRHWLKVLKINFIEEIATEVDESRAHIPTLTDICEKMKELSGNDYEQKQVVLWLNEIGIKFKMNSQHLPVLLKQPQKLTKENMDILTSAHKLIMINILKFQLKEIEWTLMLQNQKPDYYHLVRIIDTFNVFDHFTDPVIKNRVYKDWLKEIGIQFNDETQTPEIPVEMRLQTNPIIINSPQEHISNVLCPGAVLVKLTDLPTITVPNSTITQFPELVISDIRTLKNSVPTLEKIPFKNSEVRSENYPESAVASTSKESDASFKSRKSFVDESFFKNIELEFTSKGKIPSLKHIHDNLKENGLVFEESTLKKLLNSMDIKYFDENAATLIVKEEIDENTDKLPEEITVQPQINVIVKSENDTENNEIESKTKKRKGEHKDVDPKKAKADPTANNIVDDINDAPELEDETQISRNAGKYNNKSELVINIDKMASASPKNPKEHKTVQLVDITKLLDNPPETPASQPKKIVLTKPNKYSKCTDVNMSERVVSIFTDVEHQFHLKRKIPTLEDFYMGILRQCGNQYDRETIKKWLTKIGIKFKSK